MRPFDLVFPLSGANFDRWAQLTPSANSLAERWVLIPRFAGFYWTFRRWDLAKPQDRVVAHGYQDLEHWYLTYYPDPLPKIVTIVARPDRSDLQVVLRGDLFRSFRRMPLGGAALHEYDWRLTRVREGWGAEVRSLRVRAWTPIVVHMDSAAMTDTIRYNPGRDDPEDENEVRKPGLA